MKNNALNALLAQYQISRGNKGLFRLKIDWILEVGVFPYHHYYSNVRQIWNDYMMYIPFENEVIEYSMHQYPALKYLNEETFSINSLKLLLQLYIKNRIKILIIEGYTKRLQIIQKCYEELEDVYEGKLHDLINRVYYAYFKDDNVPEEAIDFLSEFYDNYEPLYPIFKEKIEESKKSLLNKKQSRQLLADTLHVSEDDRLVFNTLFNLYLCDYAMNLDRVSDPSSYYWTKWFPKIPYQKEILDFLNEYESPYVESADKGMNRLTQYSDIKYLYMDSLILISACNSGKGIDITTGDIFYYWKKYDRSRLGPKMVFSAAYDRMKDGLIGNLLQTHQDTITTFHKNLLNKIDNQVFDNDKERQLNESIVHKEIEDRNRIIDELTKTIENYKNDDHTKEEIKKLISILDHERYGYVLGHLYNIGYLDEEISLLEVKTLIRNFFEILSHIGVETYGEIGETVELEDLHKGHYRIHGDLKDEGILEYVGYKFDGQSIIRPVVKEEK